MYLFQPCQPCCGFNTGCQCHFPENYCITVYPSGGPTLTYAIHNNQGYFNYGTVGFNEGVHFTTYWNGERPGYTLETSTVALACSGPSPSGYTISFSNCAICHTANVTSHHPNFPSISGPPINVPSPPFICDTFAVPANFQWQTSDRPRTLRSVIPYNCDTMPFVSGYFLGTTANISGLRYFNGAGVDYAGQCFVVPVQATVFSTGDCSVGMQYCCDNIPNTLKAYLFRVLYSPHSDGDGVTFGTKFWETGVLLTRSSNIVINGTSLGTGWVSYATGSIFGGIPSSGIAVIDQCNPSGWIRDNYIAYVGYNGQLIGLTRECDDACKICPTYHRFRKYFILGDTKDYYLEVWHDETPDLTNRLTCPCLATPVKDKLTATITFGNGPSGFLFNHIHDFPGGNPWSGVMTLQYSPMTPILGYVPTALFKHGVWHGSWAAGDTGNVYGPPFRSEEIQVQLRPRYEPALQQSVFGLSFRYKSFQGGGLVSGNVTLSFDTCNDCLSIVGKNCCDDIMHTCDPFYFDTGINAVPTGISDLRPHYIPGTGINDCHWNVEYNSSQPTPHPNFGSIRVVVTE